MEVFSPYNFKFCGFILGKSPFGKKVGTKGKCSYFCTKYNPMRRLRVSVWLALLLGPMWAFAQTYYLNEDFNSSVGNVPPGWSIGDGGNRVNANFTVLEPDTSWGVVANGRWRSRILNGTPFVLIDSDAAGSGSTNSDTLYSPIVDVSGASVVRLRFDHFYQHYTGSYGLVDVFNGTSWQRIDSIATTQGGWASPGNGPVTKTYDVTPYKNANFRIRFIYVGNWAWHWAIDNVQVYEPLPYDLKAIAITPGLSGCALSPSTPIQIRFTNVGLNTITSTDLAYQVGANPPVVETWTGTLNPGDTATYTFTTTADLSGMSTTFAIMGSTQLAIDMNAANDMVSTTVYYAPTSMSPYVENFDGFMPIFGFQNGWSGSPTGSLTQYSWRANTGSTSYTNTGPTGDHTSGSGVYMYTESRYGSAGSTAYLNSPCIDLSGYVTPALQYWYHFYGSNINRMYVEVNDGSGWVRVDSIIGQQQTSRTAPWNSRNVDLSAFAGMTIQLRFVGIRGSGTAGNMAIDDVRIIENAVPNLQVNQVTRSQTSCTPGLDSVFVNISNVGGLTAAFTTSDTLFITVMVTGPSSGTLVDTITSGSLMAGQSSTFYVGQFDFSNPGTYAVKAYVTYAPDTDPLNDTVNTSVINPLAILPQSVNFTGFTGANLPTLFPGWNESQGFAKPNYPPTGVSSWMNDDWLNNPAHPFGTSAKINLWVASKRDWIVSPPFVPAATTALQYDIGVTDWNATILTDSLGSDDTLGVYISTDCGLTWTPLKIYTRPTTPPATGLHELIHLGSYAGQTVIIAFYGSEGTVDDPEDVDCFIDNILIKNLVPDAELTVVTGGGTPVCPGDTVTLDFAITNVGTDPILSGQLMVSGPGGNVVQPISNPILPGQSDTVTVDYPVSMSGSADTVNAVVIANGDTNNVNDFATVILVHAQLSVTVSAPDSAYKDSLFCVSGSVSGNITADSVSWMIQGTAPYTISDSTNDSLCLSVDDVDNAFVICYRAYYCDTFVEACDTVRVDVVTSVSNTGAFKDLQVAIYPNPADQVAYVQVNRAGELRIINSLGQVLITRRLEPGVTALPIASLQKGMYIVEFRASEGAVHLRFVKN
jgi:hypothetical protein